MIGKNIRRCSKQEYRSDKTTTVNIFFILSTCFLHPWNTGTLLHPFSHRCCCVENLWTYRRKQLPHKTPQDYTWKGDNNHPAHCFFFKQISTGSTLSDKKQIILVLSVFEGLETIKSTRQQ